MRAPAAEIAATFLLLALSLLALQSMHRGRLSFLSFRGAAAPREPPLWGAPQLLAGLLLAVLAQVAAAIFVGSLSGGEDDDGAALFAHLLAGHALALAAIAYLILWGVGQPLSTLGLRPTPWRNIPAALAFLAAAYLPIAALAHVWEHVLRGLGVEAEPQEAVRFFVKELEGGDRAGVALLFLGAVVVAPIAEEIVFRGFIAGQIERWHGALAAGLVSSLLFAGAHLSLSALVPLLALGWLFFHVYRRTGSIYPAMLLHAAFNGVSLFTLLRGGWEEP